MPRSLPQTGATRRRFTAYRHAANIALLLVLLIDSLVAPHFFQIIVQDGRLFGSPIDILKPCRPGGASGHWYDVGDRHRRD